jgi:hypothetical protein
VGLARDDAELAPQCRHQRPVPLPGICWQSAARPGEAGIPGRGEQVLNRNRQTLEVQALAKALVRGNCRLDQFPCGHPLLAQIARDLDQRTGEQIARHRHLP